MVAAIANRSLCTNSSDRPGGYTRLIRAGFRSNDNAAMAVLEFVDRCVHVFGAFALRGWWWVLRWRPVWRVVVCGVASLLLPSRYAC